MSAPQFVAYVYPGWHRDAFRPGVDEWRLLDTFRPYFSGHQRPAEPAAGRYDDTEPGVAARHVAHATAAGITGFTYFLYWTGTEFVLERPVRAARLAAEAAGGGFMVGGTWCVRLPHTRFPVVPVDAALERDAGPSEVHAVEDRPIDELTIAELAHLAPGWDESWLDLPAVIVHRAEGPRIAGAALPSVDAATSRSDTPGGDAP